MLQQDGSLSSSETAEQLNMTPPPCWRRIPRLKDEGILEKQVWLANAEVQDCYILLGVLDVLIKVVAKDIKAHEEFFNTYISQLPGVRKVTSIVVLTEVKNTTDFPISHS